MGFLSYFKRLKKKNYFNFIQCKKYILVLSKVEEDRIELDKKIRRALRTNNLKEIEQLSLRHPLRPLQVKSLRFREILEKEGFIFIPGSKNLMLPPAEVSRREAKKRLKQLFSSSIP